MFTYQTTIKMHETDAAGFLFYGYLFTIAHDAYEAFLDSAGFSISSILRDSDFMIPIVHAEADYYIPVSVSDRITVQLQIENIGETSFSIIYDIINEMGKIIAHAKTIHTVIDKQHKNKMKIPNAVITALNKFQ